MIKPKFFLKHRCNWGSSVKMLVISVNQMKETLAHVPFFKHAGSHTSY